MALSDLLHLKDSDKIGLSEQRVNAAIPVAREYISFWRWYPDLFIDFLLEKNNPEKFRFYFYQRIFLRATMRYRYVYTVYPRSYSKSFLSVLCLIIKAILYPGAKLFVTAGGKEQASGILKEKVTDLCHLIPALENEIDWSRGATLAGKDYCKYVFKNGSYIDNIAARESSRGRRRHGGLIEECVGVDGDILNTVILPTMNISRRCASGETVQDEVLNKSQVMVTTAGWRGTFAYDKLIQFLIWQIVAPEKACVLGGTYRVPVAEGLLDKSFVRDLKLDGTFNEASFDREYQSFWSGGAEDAFFQSQAIERCRVLRQPEYEFSGRTSKDGFYVIGVDVGRRGCASVASVIKVTNQPTGVPMKSLVNIYTLDDMHFEDQCIFLKKLYYKYHARRIVLDANGLGIGLVDYFIKQQIDPETTNIIPDFGVMNDEDGFYKKFKSPSCEYDALYLIKANAPINTEAHANVQSALSSGRLKFLIDERTAKAKLLNTQRGKQMTPEERAEYLRPFTLTSILAEEMLNLREEQEGLNIILKQANKSIKKDKFSSLEYAMYYIRVEEENKKRKHKRFNAKEWSFMN